MNNKITIALAGNPNCGKTTIFNYLTGSRQHVGNYSGVTVEKKEGMRKFRGHNLVIVDLPGTYSLTAYSLEEVAVRNYIVDEQPDVVIDIVDASNLERNLYLACQLMELGSPVIIALNMADVADTYGIKLDILLLEEGIGIKVVRTIGSRKQGLEDLLQAAVEAAKERNNLIEFKIDYGKVIEEEANKLVEGLTALNCEPKYSKRWLALKLLENDSEIIGYIKKLASFETVPEAVYEARNRIIRDLGDDPELIIADKRYQFVGNLYRKILLAEPKSRLTLSDKIDKVLTNRILAIPIFLALMWSVFNLIFTIGAYPREGIVKGMEVLTSWFIDIMPVGELKSLIIDGIIGGVGNVISFLPSILLLFLVIALLEDSGYMARAAFIMDRIMKKAGLHGKSFIPLLLGFGCSVPAIMGTRCLANPRDRIVTILVTPFMSCSAKIPIYTVLIGAFFPEQYAGSIFFSLYLLGILLAVITASLFRSFLFKGDTEPFVMEMPSYRLPTAASICRHMWGHSVLYLQKAGTLILAMSILVWFTTNYPTDVAYSKDYDFLIVNADKEFAEQALGENRQSSELINEKKDELLRLKAGEKLVQSYVGRVGKAIEPIFKPVGFNWKIDVGLIAGISGKELLVSTLGTIYNMGETNKEVVGLREILSNDSDFNPLVAYSVMVFVLVYVPCIATLATIKRETGSWKWVFFSFCYSTCLAWLLSFIVYQGGLILGIGRLIQ